MQQTTVSAVLVGLVLLGGLLFRLQGFDTPITRVRETQSASVAINLMRDGPAAILHPRVHYPGDAPGYLALEFPLVSAAQVLSMKLLPGFADASFKIPSLVAYLVLALGLFDFTRRWFDNSTALFAVSLLSVFQVDVLMSISPAPDESGVALGMAAIWLFDRHLESDRSAFLIASASALSLCSLVKAPMLCLVVPAMAGLCVARKGWTQLFAPRFAFAAVLCALPLVIWSVHSSEVNSTSRLSDYELASERVSRYASQRGRLSHYSNPGWYAQVTGAQASNFTSPGLLLGVAGLMLLALRRSPFLPVAALWTFGVLAYFLALPFHVASHSYYGLPLAPLLAVLGGVSLSYTAARLNQVVPMAGWVASIALLVTIVSLDLGKTLALLDSHRVGYVEFGRIAARHSLEGELLVVTAPNLTAYDGGLLYRADRRGWKYDSERIVRLARQPREPERALGGTGLLTVEKLEQHRADGAALYGHRGHTKRWRRTLPQVSQHLIDHYERIPTAAPYWFFDLRRKRGGASHDLEPAP